MAQSRQVAIPLMDSLPLNNPHLLNALYSHYASVMEKTVEEKLKDDIEGADVFKAMVRRPAFFSDILQHFIQSESLIQFSMLQQRLFQRLEIAVKQELFSKGISTVTLSQLEAEKYNMLAKLIQAGDDKDVLEFVRYYSESMLEFFGIPNVEEHQEKLKQHLIEYTAAMSEGHFSSAALKILRDTEQYYFEELSITAQASGFEVISYDPLFSLPKGK